jgi:hypothetical protein
MDEDSVTQNRDVFLIAVWHCPLLYLKLNPKLTAAHYTKSAADAPRMHQVESRPPMTPALFGNPSISHS